MERLYEHIITSGYIRAEKLMVNLATVTFKEESATQC
jgi:hypothetical protein